jgi:GalNAc-alpha-(1->4)-GalNAc-alpha-(1->3)-diNAcBac-PP-undecaprenol alpha-1,4-N-acetyl-D-galactosaminyltransferase
MSKICFISTGLAGGGMERSLTSLANYFASKGHEVSIVNLFKTEIFFDLDPNIKLFWPKIIRKKYHRLLYALIIVRYIRKSIRSINPDVLLCFGEWFNSYIILVTRFLNIPLFISDRMGPNLYLGIMLETARRILYRYTTGIIAQTSTAAEILFNKTKAKNIKVIPNAVNVINTDISINKKQIATVGRLSREKGHIVLLKAFSKIECKDWTLHIVGDGIKRKELANEAQLLGIEDRVIFYGYLKDFSKILGESEIFVLPSFYEGFPNALIEAMSVPIACISSNCVAGPNDIIEDGSNGILFKTGDEFELCNALDKLIKDTEYRKKLTLEAYKVRETFRFDKIAEQYLDFLLP